VPSDKGILEWFLTEYKKYYTITGGNPTTKYNGVQVYQDLANGRVSFNQQTYIEQIYRKYVGNANCRSTPSPIAGGKEGAKKFMRMVARTEPDPAMADKDYGGLLGCTGYVVN